MPASWVFFRHAPRAALEARTATKQAPMPCDLGKPCPPLKTLLRGCALGIKKGGVKPPLSFRSDRSVCERAQLAQQQPERLGYWRSPSLQPPVVALSDPKSLCCCYLSSACGCSPLPKIDHSPLAPFAKRSRTAQSLALSRGLFAQGWKHRARSTARNSEREARA